MAGMLRTPTGPVYSLRTNVFRVKVSSGFSPASGSPCAGQLDDLITADQAGAERGLIKLLVEVLQVRRPRHALVLVADQSRGDGHGGALARAGRPVHGDVRGLPDAAFGASAGRDLQLQVGMIDSRKGCVHDRLGIREWHT